MVKNSNLLHRPVSTESLSFIAYRSINVARFYDVTPDILDLATGIKCKCLLIAVPQSAINKGSNLVFRVLGLQPLKSPII